MKFEDVKVGQRVRYVGKRDGVTGLIGTCIYKETDSMVTVEFDRPLNIFHTCMGCCKANRGYWCQAGDLEPLETVEEEVVDNSIPCAPPPVDVTTNDREMSNDQVDVLIARLEDVVEAFFTIGVSRQDMLELFNDISKKHFSEKQFRDRIAKIKDKVTKCQN
jgi:hypothetical protein